MNLDTPEGFEQAKAWTAQFISQINDGGIWGVPRSNTGYRIWHSNKTYSCIMGGEECIERVLQAIGYTPVTEIEGHPV